MNLERKLKNNRKKVVGHIIRWARGVHRMQGMYTECRGCTQNAGDVHIMQGMYTECRGCTQNAGGVYRMQGMYTECRGCTQNAGDVHIMQGMYTECRGCTQNERWMTAYILPKKESGKQKRLVEEEEKDRNTVFFKLGRAGTIYVYVCVYTYIYIYNICIYIYI